MWADGYCTEQTHSMPSTAGMLLDSAKAGLSTTTGPAGKTGKSRQNIENSAHEKAELKSHAEN